MSGPPRLTLGQQLKQLESDDQNTPLDPDTAYSSLDALGKSARAGDEGREHYMDVGPSRLRATNRAEEQTLLSEKYAGKRRGRVKIFDDDEEEEEEEEEDDAGLGGDGGLLDGSEEAGDEDDDQNVDGEAGEDNHDAMNGRQLEDGEDDEAEDGDDREEEDDGDEDEEGDADEEEDGDEPDSRIPPRTASNKPANGSHRTLDPIASLRESRLADIEKGRGIKRQRVRLYTSTVILLNLVNLR